MLVIFFTLSFNTNICAFTLGCHFTSIGYDNIDINFVKRL